MHFASLCGIKFKVKVRLYCYFPRKGHSGIQLALLGKRVRASRTCGHLCNLPALWSIRWVHATWSQSQAVRERTHVKWDPERLGDSPRSWTSAPVAWWQVSMAGNGTVETGHLSPCGAMRGFVEWGIWDPLGLCPRPGQGRFFFPSLPKKGWVPLPWFCQVA